MTAVLGPNDMLLLLIIVEQNIILTKSNVQIKYINTSRGGVTLPYICISQRQHKHEFCIVFMNPQEQRVKSIAYRSGFNRRN